MQSVDTRELEDFDRTLADLLEEFPEMRRELHTRLADMMKQEVDAAIASSGVNDSNIKVRRWQMGHVGSGGGYAAARAAGGKEGAPVGPNSPGAVTNYLEGGHKIRPPKGGKGYRPRIRVAYVNGYHFYQTASTAAEVRAIREAHAFAGELAGRLEGGR